MPTPQELIAANEQAAQAVAARDDALAAELLNAPTDTIPKPGAWLTERGVMSVVANAALASGANGADAVTAAETAMQGLETVAQSNPAVARAVRWLKELAGDGIDMGDAVNQGMIAMLQQGGALTELAAGALLAYGSQQVGIWRLNFGRDATVDEISQLYATERVAADNAAILADRIQRYADAKAASDAAPEDTTLAALTARYGRELTQTLGGVAAKEAIDNG